MKFSGMTVNERLYHSGLMDKFDLAVKNKNPKEVKSILEQLELGEENINSILKHHQLIK